MHIRTQFRGDPSNRCWNVAIFDCSR